MNPPLRTWSDVEAVIGGLKDNTIEFIATDHAPHAREKKMREIDQAPFGIVGLETLIPITATSLIEAGHLTWPEAIAQADRATRPRCSASRQGDAPRPARTPTSPSSTRTRRWTIDPSRFRSKSRNTPFGGWEVRGRAHTVIVGGEVRFTRGGIVHQAGAAVPA